MLGRVAERLKDFFKTRGLYLLSAILAFTCTFFLLRLLLKLAFHQLLAHQADSPRRQMYAKGPPVRNTGPSPAASARRLYQQLYLDALELLIQM